MLDLQVIVLALEPVDAELQHGGELDEVFLALHGEKVAEVAELLALVGQGVGDFLVLVLQLGAPLDEQQMQRWAHPLWALASQLQESNDNVGQATSQEPASRLLSLVIDSSRHFPPLVRHILILPDDSPESRPNAT